MQKHKQVWKKMKFENEIMASIFNFAQISNWLSNIKGI